MTAAANQPNRTQLATDFLTELYGGMPEGGHLLIWTIKKDDEKRSAWFTSPAAAASHAITDQTTNVYVGVGWHSKDHGPFARGKAEDIAGIVGLWADIDFAGPGHIDSKKTYAPTEADAKKILAALPLQPTLTLRTGGGLQAWWLFKEAWEFESAEEREQAARLARTWGARIQYEAKALGYDVDSVWDLSRVLRVVGSYRTKAGSKPFLVECISATTTRYVVDDFDSFTMEVPSRQSVNITVGPLVLSANAEPPAQKFFVLMTNDPKFAQTYNRQRKDLKDQSQSCYDLSLATQAAMAGWTDQEIASLINSARKQHGQEPEKALRQDYITKTIQKARSTASQNDIEGELERINKERVQREKREELEREKTVEKLVEGKEAGADQDKILSMLSTVFGTPIKGVVQYGREEARFSLKTLSGEISIGRVDALLEQRKLRNRLFEAAGHSMPGYKPAQWAKVCETILKVIEVNDDDEASRLGELREWLGGYVNTGPQYVGDQWLHALANNDPFFLNGLVHVHAAGLHIYVRARLLEPIQKRDVLDRLRSAEFKRIQKSGRPFIHGKNVVRTAHYWAGPIEFMGPSWAGVAARSFETAITESSGSVQ